MVRTKEQYMKDLGRMKPNLYCDGKELDRLDDLQMDCLNLQPRTAVYPNPILRFLQPPKYLPPVPNPIRHILNYL